MIRRLFTVATLLFILGMMVGAPTFAQKKDNVEALKQKVLSYIRELYPQLQGVSLKDFQKSSDLPYYKGTVRFTAQGRVSEGYFYVSKDGRYLIIGEIFDMSVNPAKAQWLKMSQGADKRMAMINLKNRPFRGNPNASVVVIEYSDFQCPFCKRAFDTIENKLLQEYGDRIKFVYKNLPLTSIHPWAMKAAIAATCAFQQSHEAFWGMHDRLFKNQGVINTENLRSKVEAFGKELNLDTKKLLACFDNEETRAMVEADMKEAQSLGITGTPQFVINGVLLRSGVLPYQELKQFVEMALANTTKSSAKKKNSSR